MAATPDGGGYWLVASDGGIFAFGDATFSAPPAASAAKPIVGIDDGPRRAATGWWLSDGGIFAFGNCACRISRGHAPQRSDGRDAASARPTARGTGWSGRDGGLQLRRRRLLRIEPAASI